MAQAEYLKLAQQAQRYDETGWDKLVMVAS